MPLRGRCLHLLLALLCLASCQSPGKMPSPKTSPLSRPQPLGGQATQGPGPSAAPASPAGGLNPVGQSKPSLIDSVLLLSAFQDAKVLASGRLQRLSNQGSALRGDSSGITLAGGAILSNNGGGVLSDQGGGLLANNGSNLVAQGGGLLANNGSNLVAQGGGLITDNGAGQRLLQVGGMPAGPSLPSPGTGLQSALLGETLFREMHFLDASRARLYRQADGTLRVLRLTDAGKPIQSTLLKRVVLGSSGQLREYALERVTWLGKGIVLLEALHEFYDELGTGEAQRGDYLSALLNESGQEVNRSHIHLDDAILGKGSAELTSAYSQLTERYSLTGYQIPAGGPRVLDFQEPFNTFLGTLTWQDAKGEAVARRVAVGTGFEALDKLLVRIVPEAQREAIRGQFGTEFQTITQNSVFQPSTRVLLFEDQYPSGLRVLSLAKPQGLSIGLAVGPDGKAIGNVVRFAFRDDSTEAAFYPFAAPEKVRFASVEAVVGGPTPQLPALASLVSQQLLPPKSVSFVGLPNRKLLALTEEGAILTENDGAWPPLALASTTTPAAPGPGQRPSLAYDQDKRLAYAYFPRQGQLYSLNLQKRQAQALFEEDISSGPGRLGLSPDGESLMLARPNEKGRLSISPLSVPPSLDVLENDAQEAAWDQVLPAADGGEWLLDLESQRLRRMGPDFKLRFELSAKADDASDGPLGQGHIHSPSMMSHAPQGGIYLGEEALGSVRHVDEKGELRTVIGIGTQGMGGFGTGPAFSRLQGLSDISPIPYPLPTQGTPFDHSLGLLLRDPAKGSLLLQVDTIRPSLPPRPRPQALFVLQSPLSVVVGDRFTGNCAVVMEDGSISKDFTLNSSRPEVVEVAPDGHSLKALKAGEATITVEDTLRLQLKQSLTVYVLPPAIPPPSP